ncbi:MAG: ectoine synthase, partial [Stackebrandtia sp.]
MIYYDRADLVGTPRDVVNENYTSTRILLAEDKVGIGLHDVVLNPGIKDTYGYTDRTEIAYCISGTATVVDIDTGQERSVRPGMLWIAPPGSRFTVDAHE